MVEFLRMLIRKLKNLDPKIELLLEYIDINGIDRLRNVGEDINTKVYHIVMYQAFDDNLRIVYQKILRQLRSVQLRNQDAITLL